MSEDTAPRRPLTCLQQQVGRVGRRQASERARARHTDEEGGHVIGREPLAAGADLRGGGGDVRRGHGRARHVDGRRVAEGGEGLWEEGTSGHAHARAHAHAHAHTTAEKPSIS